MDPPIVQKLILTDFDEGLFNRQNMAFLRAGVA